jgi:hypothetical protein
MLELMARRTPRGRRRATQLTNHAPSLPQALQKGMRCFGRPCRGHGHVFVHLGRQTAHQRLELGAPITALGPPAPQRLAQATALSDVTRARFTKAFQAALHRHAHIRQPAQRLTQGPKLRHGTLGKAYDLPSAPLRKGQRKCPAPFGRPPGIGSDPATGFLFATRVPEGNPREPSSGLPLLATVQKASARVKPPPHPRVPAGAGDRGLNDTAWRQALHARGLLTGGLPKTVAPLTPNPSPAQGRAILNAAGVNRQRTPHQVHWACACGSRRPVVESHIASLLSRGAGPVRDQGHAGAVGQRGMTTRAHNGAVVVRLCQQRLSKRAQKFRRLLGLRRHKINEINRPKN